MEKQLVEVKVCANCVYFKPDTSYQLSVGVCIRRGTFKMGSYIVCSQAVFRGFHPKVEKICLKK